MFFISNRYFNLKNAMVFLENIMQKNHVIMHNFYINLFNKLAKKCLFLR